jgi:uncharacterized UBP type Zn finger protein
MAVNWSYFDKFEKITANYMPDYGEGDTIASQAVTAVNKLVYKWYNDGDVFDNTKYLEGWANDLSSYANWLYNHTDRAKMLDNIFVISTGSEYEDFLKELADSIFDESWLSTQNKPKEGSIYKCNGKFKFVEYGFDDEEEY